MLASAFSAISGDRSHPCVRCLLSCRAALAASKVDSPTGRLPTGVGGSIVWLALGLAALVLLAWVSPASASIDDSTIQRVDGYVQEKLEANGVPGASLAIVDGDRTVHLKAFGKTGTDDQSVTSQTPFIICSVSKSFTALAVMQLAERGMIEIDAPVHRYLSWFQVEPASQSGAITVRVLLNQTSGLSATAGGAELRYLNEQSIRGTAQTLNGEELQSPPGDEFHYSNANYVLLGAVIEAASGERFQDYVRRNIFSPLKMNHSYVDLAEAELAGLARGHRYWFGWTFPHTSYTTGLIPAGGVISTASDMARYLRMMLNGGELYGRRVLSRKGVATLTRPAVPATVGPWAKNPKVFYGMGWYVGGEPFGPRPAAFHPGGSPDFGAMAILLPAQNQGLVLLYNATPEVELPGAAGDVDRIPAGAVSILMGADPSGGWSMHTYYLVFDLLVLVLVGAAAWSLVRAIRRPVTPAQSPARAVLRVLRSALALLGGLILLMFPILTGIGWRVLSLSVPDFSLVLVILGLLLLANGTISLIRQFRQARANVERTA